MGFGPQAGGGAWPTTWYDGWGSRFLDTPYLNAGITPMLVCVTIGCTVTLPGNYTTNFIARIGSTSPPGQSIAIVGPSAASVLAMSIGALYELVFVVFPGWYYMVEQVKDAGQPDGIINKWAEYT